MNDGGSAIRILSHFADGIQKSSQGPARVGLFYSKDLMPIPSNDKMRWHATSGRLHQPLKHQVCLEPPLWQQFLKTYDKPGTLFFLDPPYYNAPYYKHNFELNDYKDLAENLSKLSSPINDHLEMRRVFNAFKQKAVQLTYSTLKNKATKEREIIISK